MRLKKAFIPLIICFLLFPTFLFSQTAQIDSLKNELQIHTKKDTTRVRLLNSLFYDLSETNPIATAELIKESEHLIDSLNFTSGKAELLYFKGNIGLLNSDYEKAIKNCNQAVKLYESLKDKKGLSYSLNSLGIAYYYLGDYPKAIEFYEESAAIDKKMNDLAGVSASLDNIGNIYADQGNYKDAISNYLKSKEIKSKLDDSLGLVTIYNNIGSVYGEQNDYPRALENFNKALDIFSKIKVKNEAEKIDLIANIAAIYQDQKSYDKAAKYYNEGLEISRKLNDKRGLVFCLNGMGFIYKAQTKNQEAYALFKEALEINNAINDKRGVAESLNHLADLQLRFKNDAKALEYYNQALEINKEMNLPIGECWSFSGIAKVYIYRKQYKKALDFALKAEGIAENFEFLNSQRDLAELFSIIHESLGNYKQALASHKQFKILNDSLFNKGTIEKLTQLEYEYKYKSELESANNRELKLSQKVKTTTVDLEQSQRSLLLGVIAFLLIGSILAGIIFFLKFRNVKSRNQNIVIEQKLLRSQMTPHFIFNSLSVLQGMILNKEDKKAVSYLSRFSKLLRIILENSRDKTVSLNQELIALENYLALHNIEESEVYNYTLLVDESIDITTLEIPPMLIQPFVENAIEHAFANQKENRKIDVHLKLENDNLICTIKDNGIGIDTFIENKKSQKKSLATTITSERLKILSKDFKIEGSIKTEDRKKDNEQGTIVTLVIPYKIDESK
jgi:tetratricopeptide (TPR) repeat protein